MKKANPLLVLNILIPFLFACEKDKLTGSNKVLVGAWTSISTIENCGFTVGLHYDPNLKLELKEKGNYRLFKHNKSIETGRIVIINGLLTFKCSEKNSELDGGEILKFNSDTLNINRNSCDDDYEFRFIKN